MTDQADDIPEYAQAPLPVISTETDWFLQELVTFANTINLESSITLQVSGMLVSGKIISGAKYFEEFAKQFSTGFRSNPELGEPFRELILSFKKIYDVPEEEQKKRQLPTYIHLQDARFFHPGQSSIPTNEGVLWRGRISEVGGFSLGTLSNG